MNSGAQSSCFPSIWTTKERLSRAHGAIQAEFLRAKYRERNIRVIVADALPALQFARDFRDRILPGVPVVHVAVASDRLEGAALPGDILGNFEDNDPTPTLKLAMRLHPNTQRIVFIRGASERDRFWDKRLQVAIQQVGTDVQIEYLAGLPTADVLRRVQRVVARHHRIHAWVLRRRRRTGRLAATVDRTHRHCVGGAGLWDLRHFAGHRDRRRLHVAL